MEGDIHVDSEEGKGSTFWFTAHFKCVPLILKCMRAAVLPCITEKRDYCKGIPPHRCARSGREVVYLQRAAELNGIKTLVAGQGEVMIPALCEQLQSWGMSVQRMNSAAEVLQYLQEEQEAQFQLIIIDYASENRVSESLVRNIQEKDHFKDLPLICLTPLSEDLRQKSWKYPKKIRSVTKPVGCSRLLDAVVRSFFDIPNTFVEDPNADDTLPNQLLRVLAVDDNKVNRIVITEILKQAKMEYVVLDSGETAVDRVKQEHFDVVLMDCQMPIVDGYEATRRIRHWEMNMPSTTRTPIIALTATVMSEDVHKCFDAGMDGYCSKPVNPVALFKEIERVIGKQKTE